MVGLLLAELVLLRRSVGCGYCGLVLLCGLDGGVGGDEVGASGVEFGAAVAGAAQLCVHGKSSILLSFNSTNLK